MRRALLLMGLAALVACSRGDRVGPAQAVEVLVLDGLPRIVAECVVDGVDDALDLAEVTGVSGDLDDDERAVLFDVSRRCRPPVALDTGTVGGPIRAAITSVEELEISGGLDAQAIASELLAGGLDPDLATCVAERLTMAPASATPASEEVRRIDAVLGCDQETTEPAAAPEPDDSDPASDESDESEPVSAEPEG